VKDYALQLTLIVVNYHSQEPLACLLESLSRNPIAAAHEIVVVNNSPGDGLEEWLGVEHPEIRVVNMLRNLGYARGVNAGIEAARGRDLLVINPDVELESGSVDRSLDYLRKHPEVGIVGARLVNADGSDQHNARRFYSMTTILLRRTPLGRMWPDHAAIRGHLMLDDDLSAAGPVDWVTGAFMLARREAVEEVGPMDGRFFLYFEDVDWCQRMWDQGYEVHLLPDVTLRHEHQRTSTRISRSLVHHLRSFFSYYDKWGALIYVARRLKGPWRTGGAVVSDALALNVAFLVAFFLRRLLDPYFPEPVFDLVEYLPLIAFTNVVSAVTLSLLGRYGARVEPVGRRSLESLQAAFLVVLVVMAGTYLSHLQTFSRAVILFFVPLYLGALELTRRWGQRVLAGAHGSTSGRRRVVVVDSCGEGHPRRDVDWILAGSIGNASGTERRLGGLGEIAFVVDRYRIDEILVPEGVELQPALLESLRRARSLGAEVLHEDAWAPHRRTVARHRLGRWWSLWRPLNS
jgi:N-acetylglucosaminyl-diphospho-decaprenol L-rhamnosyltransferase